MTPASEPMCGTSAAIHENSTASDELTLAAGKGNEPAKPASETCVSPHAASEEGQNKARRVGVPDIAAFQRLGIPVELIEQARIQRVTDQEARAKYGIVGYGDMSGVVYPYFDPASGQRVTARLRRDNPEIENGKPKNKYVSARGDRRHLFFPPGSAGLLTDNAVPIVLVESEKAALALTAWAHRSETKILAVGMGGCWGWRGRTGKILNAKGERVDEVGPLPELAHAANGRKVFVLLDANASSNSKVKVARKKLVQQLHEQSADVWVAELPTVEGVNGPDDYIGTCGDAAMTSVLTGAIPCSPEVDGASAEPQTACLLRLAASTKLFHTPEGKPYATVIVNGHEENMAVESTKFRQWLRQQYYRETKAAPRSQALQDALSTLAGQALFDGDQHQVWVRVAAVENGIVLDLGNERWEVIVIRPSGWELCSQSPVKFRRPEGMLPLPVPERGGKLDALKTFVNVADENDWRLIVAFLLQSFRPHGPYPILICNGEHGSAKSTTAKILRDLMDPNAASHSSPPADLRDVMIAANNEWVVSLDNLSKIPDWLSDALCRMATGGGLRTRQLFSDTAETIIQVQRPIVLNGIEQLTTRPDLLDRAIVVSLPKLLVYRDEKEFWNAFNSECPKLLGAMLDAIARALAELPNVTLNQKPRMADFAIWGTAIEKALGWGKGGFMAAYRQNRECSNDAVLEGSPVGTAIEKLMADAGSFNGTMTDLLKELDLHVDESVKSQKMWPRNPMTLRNALKRLAPNLRMAGIEVNYRRDGTRNRNRVVEVSRLPSALSEPSENTVVQRLANRTVSDGSAASDGTTFQPSSGKSLQVKEMGSADSADGSPEFLKADEQTVANADVIEVEI